MQFNDANQKNGSRKDAWLAMRNKVMQRNSMLLTGCANNLRAGAFDELLNEACFAFLRLRAGSKH